VAIEGGMDALLAVHVALYALDGLTVMEDNITAMLLIIHGTWRNVNRSYLVELHSEP
jgi:hypothetical protein